VTVSSPLPSSTHFKVDPITFEILQHHLWSLVEEAADTLKRVSGSPVATEIHDLNVGLMDADGRSVMIGHYSAAKGTTLSSVVTDILAEYQENPGIYAGDAFICNDPYVGVMHQNDVAIVAPIFTGETRIAWVGAEIHQIDVGGPTPGQVQLGAQDIYGEAPLIPPLKIVEQGKIRKDNEREYLRHTRVPELVALDLRAKIAACNFIRTHIETLIAQYGQHTIVDILGDIQTYAELRLGQRLSEIGDGCWRHRAYVEFRGELYLLMIELRKEGAHLTIDFSGTARQAAATINITRAALVANVMGNIASRMSWQIPRSVGGLSRVVSIITEPGTIVDATFPAGVSKSTTSTGLMISGSLSLLFSKMFLSSEKYKSHAMGGWPGAKAQEELHGVNQRGEPFAADILDGMAGGGGARTWKDGIDTGGLGSSPKTAIANVEHYEFAYPILYLYRRELVGSGGAGKFRGGNGIDRAYIVHDQTSINDMVMHCVGYEIPASSGIAGGRPSVTNQFYLLHNSNIREVLARSLPTDIAELTGQLEACRPMTRTQLSYQDVYRSISNGGCGYGDPLEREIGLVEQDLQYRCITPDTAMATYGVVFVDGHIDESASQERRAMLREQRLCSAEEGVPWDLPQEPMSTERAITETLFVGRGGQQFVFLCQCGQPLAPLEDNYKKYVKVRRYPVQDVAGHVHPSNRSEHSVEFREFLCPHCGALIESEIARNGDPFVWDYQPLLKEKASALQGGENI